MAVDDFSQLDAFAAELLRATPAVQAKVRPIVSKGALNIKNQLREEAEKSPHFKRIAWTINYDLIEEGDEIGAEIGPEKKHGHGSGGGNLANVAYFGGAHGGGASLPDPQKALDDEGDRFMAALEMVVDL